MRLALNEWKASDSTVGAWATQWKLPVSSDGAGNVEREIWLWDFGGQADQRLIHQLYMDDTALAVLVFDGQKEDLFETLGQWDRDLTRASRKTFAKLLAAGRVDAGGLRVSRKEVEKFAKERGFRDRLFETSAKADIACEELKQAILVGHRLGEHSLAIFAAALQAAQGGDHPPQGRRPRADALQRTARRTAPATGRRRRAVQGRGTENRCGAC